MRLNSHRQWRHHYLIIAPHAWRPENPNAFWLRDFEVLATEEAALVIAEIASKDPPFLRSLVRAFLPFGHDTEAPPGSYDETIEDERNAHALVRALGRGTRDGLPDFARIFICMRKIIVPAYTPFDPWQSVRSTIQEAQRAPRAYVVIETHDVAGKQLASVRLELLLADGEVRTVVTNSEGRARLEPIPRGQVHIRVPEIEGSSWWPAEGADSSLVDQGRRRFHHMRSGECLARVAHMYGVRDWKSVWAAAGNEALRNRRKLANLVRPGDDVAVPALKVHEIVRATDATHRIVIRTVASKERIQWST